MTIALAAVLIPSIATIVTTIIGLVAAYGNRKADEASSLTDSALDLVSRHELDRDKALERAEKLEETLLQTRIKLSEVWVGCKMNRDKLVSIGHVPPYDPSGSGVRKTLGSDFDVNGFIDHKGETNE